MVVFAGLEVLLAMAIPFIAIEGYHTLMDSRAGTFVEAPGQGDPGWVALVDHTPIRAVVETLDGSVTGVSLVVGDPGAVMLVPGSVVIDGARLADLGPDEAATAVAREIRLRLVDIMVLDEVAWPAVLGDHTYTVNSPDPVTGPDGTELVGVGSVTLAGDDIATFLGTPAVAGDLRSATPRRAVLWSALVADPPEASTLSAHPLALALARIDTTSTVVVEIATRAGGDGLEIDPEIAESQVTDLVPFPAGPEPGSRLQVELVDRTGTADLQAVAALVAARGVEVVSVANAAVFDQGSTELVVPADMAPDGDLSHHHPAVAASLVDLSASVGGATVVDAQFGAESAEVGQDGTDTVVRLLIGNDFDLTEFS